MNNFETEKLKDMILAPYMQVATALIGKSRKIGGNQFRHTWAAVGILIDHKVIDSVILKAAMLHDLKEDAPEAYNPEYIRSIDADGFRVVELVDELSVNLEFETKDEYLYRVMVNGTPEAKIIKLADRISNLTDIQLGTFNIEKVYKTLEETRKFILPYAANININMFNEIKDLIDTRTKYVHRTIELIVEKVIDNLVDHMQKLRMEANEKISNLSSLSMSDIQKILSSSHEERKIIQEHLCGEIVEFNTIVDSVVDNIIYNLKTDLISKRINPYY